MDMGIIGAAIDAVADSGAANKEATLNHYYYRRNEDRANDAVQRHVRDLFAAGLNPMLALSSPGGSSAVPQAPAAPRSRGTNFASAGSAVNASRLAAKQAEVADAQIGQIKATTAKEAAETKRILDSLPAYIRGLGGEAARKSFGQETLKRGEENMNEFWKFLERLGSGIGHSAADIKEGIGTYYERLKDDVRSGKYKTKE